MAGPRRILQGLLPPQRVLPPSHAGPPPPPPPQNLYHHRQIHASRPPSQRSHGVRPPAASAVPMRAPAASSGGTSEDLQQIPCHSIPSPPPEAVRPCPSCIPGLASPQRSPVFRRRKCLRRWTGCRFGSTRAFPDHAVKNRFSRPGGCRLRWTLRTSCGPSRLAKPVRLRNLGRGEQARWAGF